MSRRSRSTRVRTCGPSSAITTLAARTARARSLASRRSAWLWPARRGRCGASVRGAAPRARRRPRSDLAPEERARLETHLAGCAPCRTELAVVRGFDFAAVSAAPRHRGSGLRLRRPRSPRRRRGAAVAAAHPRLAVCARTASGSESADGAEIERSAPLDIVARAAAEAQPEPSPCSRGASRRAGPVARPSRPGSRKPRPVAIPPAGAGGRQAPPPEPPRPLQIAALAPCGVAALCTGALASGASVRIGGAARGLGARDPGPRGARPRARRRERAGVPDSVLVPSGGDVLHRSR